MLALTDKSSIIVGDGKPPPIKLKHVPGPGLSMWPSCRTIDRRMGASHCRPLPKRCKIASPTPLHSRGRVGTQERKPLPQAPPSRASTSGPQSSSTLALRAIGRSSGMAARWACSWGERATGGARWSGRRGTGGATTARAGGRPPRGEAAAPGASWPAGWRAGWCRRRRWRPRSRPRVADPCRCFAPCTSGERQGRCRGHHHHHHLRSRREPQISRQRASCR
mmetsp:Transcript_122842/g.352812  ORF Transcript_122842/g.352812 Transcript_122842/m.352812 type:complete len:222 (+) Transcript_122842:389-1054(+)